MRTSQGNQTERKAVTGDKVIVSHGYNRKAGCHGAGKVATVTASTEATFTMECPCGQRFQVMQRDGYQFAEVEHRKTATGEAQFIDGKLQGYVCG